MPDSEADYRDIEQIPSRYLSRLFEVAKDCGINFDHFLAEHDLNAKWLAEKRNSVSHRVYLAGIDALLRETDDPDIGLSVGERIRITDHGVLGYAVVASATLQKGLDRFLQYQQILVPLIQNEFHSDGKTVCIVGKEAFPLGAKYRFAVSSWLAETSQIRELCDAADMKFSCVRLTYPDNKSRTKYENLLECDVLFDQEVNEIQFADKYLQERFSLADSSVAELCVQHCEKVLDRLDENSFLVDKVRRVIMARPGEIPTLDEVAENINMTSRTLRRHLRSAGTSFSEIVNEVRMNLAAEYLINTHLPPKEIAYLIGYSEVAAFHRAFSRHFKRTPNKYRDQPFAMA